MKSLPNRRRPAHQPVHETGNRAIIVFLTLCTKHRKPILASPEAFHFVVSAWQEAKFWRVGRFVIMPDHVHLFCAPGVWPPHPLGDWIHFWRRAVARSWTRPAEKPIWQKDYWDHQLRSGDSYSEKWEYVRHNPVRHELVASADQWPYQGELETLRWHD